MGLRREVLEEMEERECQAASESIMRRTSRDTDEEIHGIGWRILHNKFIEDEEPGASEIERMNAQQAIKKVKKNH